MELTSLFENATWVAARPWFTAGALIAGGFIVARIASGVSARVTRRGGSEHLSAVTQRMVFYAVMLMAFFGALNVLGIQPSALLTTAGLLTVAIGFAAQTSVANVISGIFLLIDRPFSINDTVMVDGTQGVVTAIDLLSTKLRTFDNLVVRFPNEAMLKATITNYTRYDVRRIEQRVTVSYQADLSYVLALLTAALRRHTAILDEPEPFVLVDALAENGVSIVVRAWCARVDYIQARSELTKSLKESLQAGGVDIVLPQRVVHQVAPVADP